MKKIGFDFGTTNSMISYFDSKDKKIEPFSIDGHEYYLPTIISYKKKDNRQVIGSAAKSNIGDSDYETHKRFKLFLGADFDKSIHDSNKTPLQITEDYIVNLLELYREKQNLDALDAVVMTVPAVWRRERRNVAAVDNIMTIFRNKGISAKLESEPEAACVYFCWAYEQANRNKFEGHALVIDFGGGTLDLALCRLAKEGLGVLEIAGYGEHDENNGCAGVAFDEAVVSSLISKINKNFVRDKKYNKALIEFERKKIHNCAEISEKIDLYYDDPSLVEGDVIFKIDYGDEELKVETRDMVDAFKKVNLEHLKQALVEMQGYFSAHQVNAGSQSEKFKVLLVGGFSNFHCVKKEVMEFFGSKIDSDDVRFQICFPEMDRSYAISKGAALVAEEIIPIVQKSHFAYGVVANGLDYIEVLPKGKNLSEARTPVYSKVKFSAKLRTAKPEIFLDDSRRKRKIKLDRNNEELFPNFSVGDVADKRYQIGFSLDASEIPTLHIKDQNGNEKKHSLNKIIESLPAIEVED
ncbi:MAG: Hsp70 family protein [Firmicutes bacterium]|nr:Hsp70 family protein [Bacillota bacterium]